jgi:hypothetical protein
MVLAFCVLSWTVFAASGSRSHARVQVGAVGGHIRPGGWLGWSILPFSHDNLGDTTRHPSPDAPPVERPWRRSAPARSLASAHLSRFARRHSSFRETIPQKGNGRAGSVRASVFSPGGSCNLDVSRKRSATACARVGRSGLNRVASGASGMFVGVDHTSEEGSDGETTSCADHPWRRRRSPGSPLGGAGFLFPLPPRWTHAPYRARYP